MILTNARLIFPGGIRDGLEVVVEEGKIAEIRPPAPIQPSQPLRRSRRLRRTGEQTRTSSKDVVDLDGNYLAPGFVDLHVHGALGWDTMDSSAEAFRTICDFHARGGTTSLLLTTATAPLENIVDALKAVRDYQSSISAVVGVHLEGPFISKVRCGAQRAEFIQDPSPPGVRQLLEYVDVIRRV
ncbi:MAG: amidohydrolase family protein, partial [Candidatus Udaeobacter sp.]